jgi:hypothetical protein
MMPIDWGKRALGDFRSWHLADMRVSANVRFAPKAVVAQAGLAPASFAERETRITVGTNRDR